MAGYDEMALIFPVIAAIEYPRARGNVGVRGNMVQLKFYSYSSFKLLLFLTISISIKNISMHIF